jgi:hypothetical protein
VLAVALDEAMRLLNGSQNEGIWLILAFRWAQAVAGVASVLYQHDPDVTARTGLVCCGVPNSKADGLLDARNSLPLLAVGMVLLVIATLPPLEAENLSELT